MDSDFGESGLTCTVNCVSLGEATGEFQTFQQRLSATAAFPDLPSAFDPYRCHCRSGTRDAYAGRPRPSIVRFSSGAPASQAVLPHRA